MMWYVRKMEELAEEGALIPVDDGLRWQMNG